MSIESVTSDHSRQVSELQFLFAIIDAHLFGEDSLPMEEGSNQVTRLLQLWSGGDQFALEQLTPIVFQELHRLAHRYMSGEREGHLLQTTALINEVRRLLEDPEYRQQVVDPNYNVARRYFSYSVVSRKLRAIVANIRGS